MLYSRVVLVILFTFFLAACGGGSGDSGGATNTSSSASSSGSSCLLEAPIEQFDAADTPYSVSVGTSGWSMSTPWGYDRPENAARIYPLVVNGAWGEGGYFNQTVRQQAPAFYMDYQRYSESEGADLADLIDIAVAQGHRIDESRIYLTGFSAGGSGSYKLVRGFLSKGRLFAGIIRVAGQSESVFPDEAVAATSIWYHIGLDDTPTRVQVAKDAYDFLKNHTLNATAVESSVTDTIGSYDRTTKTLTMGGIEIVKYTQYPGVGHTPGPAYADPAVFDWLFGQSLDCR